MQAHNIVSKSGIAAGVVCAVVPLGVTATLFYRYLTHHRSLDEIMAWLFVTLIFGLPALFFIRHEVNKYYDQRMAGDDTLPTDKVKLAYGAAHGLIISTFGLGLVFAWLLFFE